MSTTTVGPKHQVTIPREAFEKLHLAVGDILEAQAVKGKLVLLPKKLIEKAPVPKLSPRQQRTLLRARRKILRIRKDLSRARGLTPEEANVAARVGLIAKDQRWWWTEVWQKGEREAAREIKSGRTKTFGSAKALVQDLYR